MNECVIEEIKMKHLEENYDIVVVGAGHAGCEAALAGARLGLSTIMFTVSAESIALMPCNPNVGGSSKGHLVRELDALGGEMGKNIDKTFIQSKMLNCSKGPAVHSLRAQADKQAYSNEMRKTLENQENLTIRQGEVTKLLVEDGKITGVKTYSGAVYHCKAVVLCTGTYLKARCIYGDVSNYTGPNGLQAANYLTDSLKELGIEMFRFKTGTPARIAGNTIDYSKMEEQFGDERVVPFSFSTDPEDVQIEQKSCWLTYTNETTHDIIRANLDRSPLYSGMIEGTGPRYCPSIEDKVVRFADKKDIRCLLSQRECTQMRCTLAVCPALCRKMCRRKCTTAYQALSMQKLRRMLMLLSTIALTQDSFIQRWSLRKLKVFSVADSLMEVQVTRRQQPRD